MLFSATIPILIEHHQLGTKDAHGNPSQGYSNPTEALVYAVAPTITQEPTTGNQGRDYATSTTWDIYAPLTAQIGPYDRITLPNGTTCEVIGNPKRWQYSPFPPWLQVDGQVITVQEKKG